MISHLLLIRTFFVNMVVKLRAVVSGNYPMLGIPPFLPAMALLHILTLGPPKIQTANKQEPSPLRRRERALLFFLAAAEQPVTRDTLIDLLWDEETGLQKANRSLSVSLSRLKQVLPEGALVRAENLYYLAVGDAVFSDYRAFLNTMRSHFVRADSIPQNEPIPKPILEPLLQAAGLWRGRFLQGFTPPREAAGFDHWVTRTADALETQYFNLARRLAWHFWAERDLGMAIRFARQALQIRPQEAELLLMVLRALHWQGKHAVARDFIAEMQALHREKVGYDYQDEILRACQPYLKPAPYQPIRYTHTQPRAPFVGYESELRVLKERLLDGGIWLITGHPGEGKSRLLEELSMQLGGRWRVIAASCHQGENRLPFAPLLEAFSKHVAPDEWSKVPQEWWPYLITLFPEIETRLPPVVLPKPSAALQVQLMEALRQVLLVLTREHPLLFTIDDIQWADLATLETIIYWHSRPPLTSPPLAAIVMTSRYGDLESSVTGAHLLPLLRTGKISQIHLGGLSEDEVRILAEQVAGRIFAPEEVKTLWQLSMAGTPLYLLEILRFQIKTDQIAKPVNQWLLPQTLAALLEARLHGLSATAAEVLEYLAVQGSEIPHHVLCKAVKQSEEELSKSIDELLKAGWLEHRTDRGQTLYTLAHHRMSEVISEQIPPGRYRLINSRLARAWENTLGEAARRKAAVIAQHYQQAGEPKEAFRWWIEAARHAISIGVTESAHQAFRNAEQLVSDENAPFSSRQIWALYAEWQVLAADTMTVDVLRHIAEQLRQLSHTRHSALLEGTALNAEAFLAGAADNMLEEERLSRKAIQILENEPGAEIALAEACATLSGALSIQTKVKESLECLQRGLAYVTSKPIDAEVARALGSLHYQLAVSWTLAQNPQKALEHANASLEAYRRSQRIFGIPHAIAARSLALLRLRRYNEALEDCHTAREQAALLNKRRLWGFVSAYCAMIHMALGNLDEVLRVVKDVNEARESGKLVPRGAIYLIEEVIGDGFLYLESWEKAIEHYHKSLQLGSDLLASGDLLPRLALAHAFLGDHDQALAEIARVLSLYRRELGTPYSFLYVDEAIINYLRGEREEILQRLKPLLEDKPPMEKGARALAHLVLSRVYADLGDKNAAVREANSSLHFAKESEYYWISLMALIQLASLDALTPAQKRDLGEHYQKLLRVVEDEFWGDAVRGFLNHYTSIFPSYISVHAAIAAD